MLDKIASATIIYAALLFPRVSHCQYRYRQKEFQKGLYLLAGIGVDGVPYNYSFAKRGNYLNRGWVDSDGSGGGGNSLSLAVGIQYRYSRSMSVEIGALMKGMFFELHDKYFMQENGIKGNDFNSNLSDYNPQANAGNFISVCSYSSYYVAFNHFFPSQGRTNLYVASGLVYNHAVDPTDLSTNFASTNGEQLDLKIHYTPFYISSFVEGGINIHPRADRKPQGSGPICFIGLKYFIAGNIIEGDYTNSNNGQLTYTDHAYSGGNYLSFVLKIGVGIFSHSTSDLLRHGKVNYKKTKRVPIRKSKQNDSNTRGW
ncbi:MAG TPA: hypothetical protein VGQ59_03995 [Cyclobacteriaceae bacterium]|nr:hypothetical protein [Cyclobacteriaceae bacterium]